MQQEVEQLREALASANQLAAAQAQRLRERDLVLGGIRALSDHDEPAVLLDRMFSLLGEALPFDQALVLGPEPAEAGGQFACIAATDPAVVGRRWPAGGLFSRVADGKAAVVPDSSRLPDWGGGQPWSPPAGGGIYVPIVAAQGPGLLVLCSGVHGAYSAKDLALVSGLGLLVSQTLAAKQRRRLADAVQRSEVMRLAAVRANEIKSTFLANMSHEIRTPLNGVVAVADLLASANLPPREQEMASMILASGRMLERLLNDVLDFSKIEAGHMTVEHVPFHLIAELQPVLDLYAAQARAKGLAFEVHPSPTATRWFAGDGARVAQVVANLLSNAVKFTRRGGVRVDVDADLSGKDAAVTIRVHDTGCGFSEEAATRLFERFEQADGSITREFGGTGLGLSICRSLATRLGGDISAKSEPGAGAQFTFTFIAPAVPAPAQTAAAPETDAAAPQRLKILIAEDNANNRRILDLILESISAEMNFAENGEEALSLFRDRRFDLVLMDLQMPVMDGLTAMRAIRSHEAKLNLARTPIIALSANAMTHHVSEALEAGADGHLAKPINPAALLATITKAETGRPPDKGPERRPSRSAA